MSERIQHLVWIAIIVAVALTHPVRAASRELTVSAASSIAPAVEEVARIFEQGLPGVKVVVNQGGSGVLMQQIRRNAPVDLFISASSLELDRLERGGLLLPGSRRSLASNELVLVVPRDRAAPRILHDLMRPEFDVIAVGNPLTAPLGRYTSQALQSLGLLETLQPRLVKAENARQVLDYVIRGAVAAGIVYANDALRVENQLNYGPSIAPSHYPPIVYAGAVIRGAEDPGLAIQLLETLQAEIGREVLQRRGFLIEP